MPPGSGTGKKGGAMRQRSRNTTPSSVPPTASLPPIEAIDAEYLSLRVEQFRNISYDDLVDQGTSAILVPDARSVDGMIARLTRLQEVIDRRTNFCDKAMRDLALQRKHHVDDVPDAPDRSRGDDDQKRDKKKKRKATDSLAPGDTGNRERSSPLREPTKPRKFSRDKDSASSSLSPVEPATPAAMAGESKKRKKVESESEDSSSDDDGAPPRAALPAANTFGDDPSTFPDPTVYEIRDASPSMTEAELKEIYSVAVYPKSDLADLLVGDPPDKDFGNVKPANQISFSTFSSHVDPYFRHFTEEDMAFLRDRSDRVGPFHLPKRGKRHYSEIWAEEDGAMQLDSPHRREKLAPNQARGIIDNMDDEVGETDKLAVGPLLSRLLQTMRTESRPQADDDKVGVNGATNGDVSMNGDIGDGASFGEDKPPPVPPAAFMPESNSEAWKKATHPKLDYAQVDERIKQELKHLGFLPQEGNFESEYDGAYDDDIGGRLRMLQDRLRQQVLINGARKARLTDLIKEKMAHQEYQTILEDLDSQVQAAYLKRTRTMGKSKKNKRPGGAVAAAAQRAAGMAKPGIGDVTRTLMERRKRWIDTIGSVFDDESLSKAPRVVRSDTTIFPPGEMASLMKKEKDDWDEEVEEE